MEEVDIPEHSRVEPERSSTAGSRQRVPATDPSPPESLAESWQPAQDAAEQDAGFQNANTPPNLAHAPISSNPSNSSPSISATQASQLLQPSASLSVLRAESSSVRAERSREYGSRNQAGSDITRPAEGTSQSARPNERAAPAEWLSPSRPQHEQALAMASVMLGETAGAGGASVPPKFKTFKERLLEQQRTSGPARDSIREAAIHLPGYPHVIALSAQDIPNAADPNEGHYRRLNAAVKQAVGPPKRNYQLRPLSPEPEDVVMDGFVIIRSCDVDLPELVEEVKLEGTGIVSIVQEDLHFFTAVRSMRLDNNRIRDFAPLGTLPALRSLSLSCNQIRHLPDLSHGFSSLQILDISFNHVSVEDVFGRHAALARMPSLKELDVSGNALRKLPEALGSWPSLRTLRLECNALTSACLQPLAALPLLEELRLGHNRISRVPETFAESFGAFRKLRCLDLSFNRIRHADALSALEGLHSGVEVLIGDNPIAIKLRFDRLEPRHLPHSLPGSVASTNNVYAPLAVSLATRAPDPNSTNQSNHDQAGVVTLKVKDSKPDKPTLATSLAQGLNAIRSSLDLQLLEVDRGALKFSNLSHDRILEVFDHIHEDIENWRQLAPVEEEAEAEDAGCAKSQHEGAPVSVSSPTARTPSASVLRSGFRLPTTAVSGGTELELDEFEDPSEQLAFQLGLDPLLLAHHSGLVGTDYRGALARLKFALCHSVARPEASIQDAGHLKLTASASLKRRARELKPIIQLPAPPSRHRKQVAAIETVIQGMKARLQHLQQDVVQQLQLYAHLLDPLDAGDVEAEGHLEGSMPGELVREKSMGSRKSQPLSSPGAKQSGGRSMNSSRRGTADSTSSAERENTPLQKLSTRSTQSAVLASAAQSAALGYAL